jgi:hypothetical protein
MACEALADENAALRDELLETRADRDSYRELALTALHALHTLTRERDQLCERLYRLVAEVRKLRAMERRRVSLIPLTDVDIPWNAVAEDGPLEQPTAQTLAQVEGTLARWIRDDDPIPTRAVLAAYVANRWLDGDPVWLLLVGGSGVGKTERIAPLEVMPDVILGSSISGPAALLSGTGKKERAKDATGGVLRKLPNGNGLLLLKDFTSIIDMQREARAEVLAALREIYDGRWDRSIGAEGGRTLSWSGHLGLIAGCTTAIDSAHGVVSVMGTRFLYIRLQASDEMIAGAAFDHVGDESPMRAALRAAVKGLLENPCGRPYDNPTFAVRSLRCRHTSRARDRPSTAITGATFAW